MESNLDKRYQTLVILWFALFMSVGMYFLLAAFLIPEASIEPDNPPSFVLMVTLTTLGALLVIGSFAVKRKLLDQSVEKQDVNLVQKALVIACAMCEVCALFGLLERLVFGNREYYLPLLFAGLGIAFHFPRRSQLEAASYKNPAQLS